MKRFVAIMTLLTMAGCCAAEPEPLDARLEAVCREITQTAHLRPPGDATAHCYRALGTIRGTGRWNMGTALGRPEEGEQR